GVEGPVLAHRLTGAFAPTEEAYLALGAPAGAAGDAMGPYPFCLAHQLDVPVEELGAFEDWYAEWKWDGIRAQVVRRGERDVAMWSRAAEPIGGQFPEIARAAMGLPRGTVLDGEVLAWKFGEGRAEGRAMSFNALQARLNRKGVQDSLFTHEGIVFVAFDLLEAEGVDVRARALVERRVRLEEIVREVQRASGDIIR